MAQYRAASYQQDVIDELLRQAEVVLYGPGYPGYRPSDTIDEVVKRLPHAPDCIILGHSWLSDRAGAVIDPHPNLNLRSIDLRKVAILNKEYVNLDAKLGYIHKHNFDLAFSHHHDVEHYSRVTGVPFVHLPFGFDHRRFGYDGESKVIDLMFSGILQNQNQYADQSDIRFRVMQELFYCVGDLPITKKSNYRDMDIFWNAIPRQSIVGTLVYKIYSLAFPKYRYRYVTKERYVSKLRRSRIILNAPSPMGLISPRYFETMASKALVLCEESVHYGSIFPDNTYVSFKSDMSDFDAKLSMCLARSDDTSEIVERESEMCLREHRWENRVQFILTEIFEN